MDKNVRIHVWVKGRVQSVAFRAFVQKSAAEIGITGWVRNVGYNTVETIAEGNPEQILQFAQTMKRGPVAARVDEYREELESVTGEFTGFRIKRSV